MNCFDYLRKIITDFDVIFLTTYILSSIEILRSYFYLFQVILLSLKKLYLKITRVETVIFSEKNQILTFLNDF